MSELKAEDFYNEIKEFVDKPQFTKLTSTGISSDYKSVFEFAEAYYDARIEANGVTTGEKQCNLPVVSVSDLKCFIEWKDKQNKDYLGGKFMYDIKGYYKRLDESELLDYWLEHVYSR